MKLSQLFTKTSRDVPSDETSKNAQLLIKAGFVNKTMAGVYTYLPLGLRALNKIENIVRKHMNSLGAQEMKMSMLHPAELWQTSGGWDSIDVLFKIHSRTKRDYALGQSEEEVVTPIIKEYVSSYKDLPFLGYQIHWKFRDELRAKSGVMRGREFLMKDLYSLHQTQEEFELFYQKIKQVYIEIYKEMGLLAKATEASGGSFSPKISYEFMVLTDAGEDDILYSENSDYCINQEITNLKPGDMAPDKSGPLKSGKASEVGNVFDLGTRYQELFDMYFTDQNGQKQRGVMGCYGIGITRLLGVIAETHSDDKGLVWPASVAPFNIHLISQINPKDDNEINEKIHLVASSIYQQGITVQSEHIQNTEILWDERQDISLGQKFADAELIGCPWQLVVTRRSLEQGGVELKNRKTGSSHILSISI